LLSQRHQILTDELQTNQTKPLWETQIQIANPEKTQSTNRKTAPLKMCGA